MATQRARRRWIGLLILLASGISGLAVLLGSVFMARSREASMLEDLYAAMYRMSSLEWQATAAASVDEEVDHQMAAVQAEILGSLEALEESDALPQATVDDMKVLLAAINTQFVFLEAGSLGEAAKVDEEVVDPLFDSVAGTLNEVAHRAASDAANAFKTTTVLLVLTIALGVIAAGLMVHWFERESSLVSLVVAKDRFIATVSHELRTPLTAIRGLAEILGSDIVQLEEQERHQLLGVMVEQTTEMSEIIDDLLVAARADIGTLAVNSVPVRLHPVVESVVGAIEFKPGTTVTVEVPPAAGVRADPVRLRQILRNLLTNANRYGGHEVIIRAHGELGMIRLEVVDNGLGVSEADMARIFQPFVQLGRDKPTGSVGIGLFISRQLALLMKGDLTAQSVPTGAVFRLELPIAPVQDLLPAEALAARL